MQGIYFFLGLEVNANKISFAFTFEKIVGNYLAVMGNKFLRFKFFLSRKDDEFV